jgi:hypothetical protein
MTPSQRRSWPTWPLGQLVILTMAQGATLTTHSLLFFRHSLKAWASWLFMIFAAQLEKLFSALLFALLSWPKLTFCSSGFFDRLNLLTFLSFLGPPWAFLLLLLLGLLFLLRLFCFN